MSKHKKHHLPRARATLGSWSIPAFPGGSLSAFGGAGGGDCLSGAQFGDAGVGVGGAGDSGGGYGGSN